MKISIYLLCCILVLALPKAASAADWRVTSEEEDSFQDTREIKLKKYLENQNSPLLSHTDDLIQIADRYKLRYSFIPAIAGLESGFGKLIPYQSYNCYGWGPGIRFESWEDGMEKVARGIKENYVQKWGKDTVDKIAPVYASSPTWAIRIKNFISQIESTETPEYFTLQPNL